MKFVLFIYVVFAGERYGYGMADAPPFETFADCQAYGSTYAIGEDYADHLLALKAAGAIRAGLSCVNTDEHPIDTLLITPPQDDNQ